MKKIIVIVIAVISVAGLNSCSRSATCDCTIRENGVVVDEPVYESAGNDPTCNDFEYVETEDSVTTEVTCLEV